MINKIKSIRLLILTLFLINSCSIISHKYHVKEDDYVQFSSESHVFRQSYDAAESVECDLILLRHCDSLVYCKLIELEDSVSYYGCPVINRSFDKYYRQVVSYRSNKGKDYIYLNYCWKEHFFTADYQTKLIMPLDACSYFWESLYNVTEDKVEFLMIGERRFDF